MKESDCPICKKTMNKKTRVVAVAKNMHWWNFDIQLGDELCDFGIDSIDHVEFIIELEKEFKIAIPDEKAERLRTLQDFVDHIEGK